MEFLFDGYLIADLKPALVRPIQASKRLIPKRLRTESAPGFI